MDQFCTACGKQLQENALFCGDCGTKILHTETTPPAAKSKKGLIIGIIAGASALFLTMAMAAGALVYFVFFSSTPETAIRNELYLECYGDTDLIEKRAPQEFWDYCIANGQYDSERLYLEREIDRGLDSLEEQYGHDYEVTFEIVEEKAFSSQTVAKIADALHENYNIDKASVRAAKELKFTCTIRGSKGEHTADSRQTVVQIGNTWYCVSYTEYNDKVFVSFRTI